MRTVEMTIEKIIPGGLGLGQVEGRRFLVPFTAPGERVRVSPWEEHPQYVRANLVEVLEPHPKRRGAPCPHFGVCGGCDFQYLPLEEQLAAKRMIAIDAFRRIAKLDVEEILGPPDPVPPEFGYRNRIRLSYSREGRVGLLRRGSNEVVPIERCLLLPEGWNRVALPWLRSLPTAEKASFRLDMDGNMIAALTGNPVIRSRLVKRMSLLEKDEPPFPGAIGVLFNARPIKGRADFEVRLGGRRLIVSAGSFFQVNYAGAAKLLEAVAELLGGTVGGTLLDLYAGVGTFAASLRETFDRVIAVEIARSAARDFRRNVALNGLSNVELIDGPVEKALPEISGALGDCRPRAVLCDPPRTGLERGVVPALADLAADRIVYVSCDPATLARDVARLGEYGYALSSLEVIDLFPQSAHVECVAAMEKTAA